MNDRIKKLAEQAMQYAEQLHGRFHEGHEDPNWDTYIAFQQKFAELIINECVDLFVSDHDEEHDEILESIKEHFFGVEA